MARRPSATETRAAAKPGRTKATVISAENPTRIEKLVELVDHCTAAKATADELGEKLLSYLLAMAIQESRAAMRQTSVLFQD